MTYIVFVFIFVDLLLIFMDVHRCSQIALIFVWTHTFVSALIYIYIYIYVYIIYIYIYIYIHILAAFMFIEFEKHVMHLHRCCLFWIRNAKVHYDRALCSQIELLDATMHPDQPHVQQNLILEMSKYTPISACAANLKSWNAKVHPNRPLCSHIEFWRCQNKSQSAPVQRNLWLSLIVINFHRM